MTRRHVKKPNLRSRRSNHNRTGLVTIKRRNHHVKNMKNKTKIGPKLKHGYNRKFATTRKNIDGGGVVDWFKNWRANNQSSHAAFKPLTPPPQPKPKTIEFSRRKIQPAPQIAVAESPAPPIPVAESPAPPIPVAESSPIVGETSADEAERPTVKEQLPPVTEPPLTRSSPPVTEPQLTRSSPPVTEPQLPRSSPPVTAPISQPSSSTFRRHQKSDIRLPPPPPFMNNVFITGEKQVCSPAPTTLRTSLDDAFTIRQVVAVDDIRIIFVGETPYQGTANGRQSFNGHARIWLQQNTTTKEVNYIVEIKINIDGHHFDANNSRYWPTHHVPAALKSINIYNLILAFQTMNIGNVTTDDITSIREAAKTFEEKTQQAKNAEQARATATADLNRLISEKFDGLFWSFTST